jgi:hypothetical protein
MLPVCGDERLCKNFVVFWGTSAIKSAMIFTSNQGLRTWEAQIKGGKA